MKSQYLYFGRKGYYSQAGVAPSSQLAALTEITVANGGFVPVNVSAGGGDAKGLQVVYRVHTAGSSKRGSAYTEANSAIGVKFGDLFTAQVGALDTTDEVGTGYADTPANHVADQVTLLLDEGYTCSSGVVTVLEATGTGDGSATAGATLTTADSVWIHDTKLVASGNTPLNAVGQDIVVAAKNFLGATTIAQDAGNGSVTGSGDDNGIHWNGDAMDVTELYFKSGDSANAKDVIRLKHSAGKFKEIMQIMQEFYNGNNYDELITVHELDYNGQNVHKAFLDNNIVIYGCAIEPVARS